MDYIDILEHWALRAAEALQEFCDEAQAASDNPEGECQLRDIRQLLDEHSRIVSGLPTWQSQINTVDSSNKIIFGDQRPCGHGKSPDGVRCGVCHGDGIWADVVEVPITEALECMKTEFRNE